MHIYRLQNTEPRTCQVRRLLANGLRATDADYDNRTPLHLASSEGHVAVVKLLLDKRADIHALDR